MRGRSPLQGQGYFPAYYVAPTILPTPPSAPRNLSATSVANPVLTWDAPLDIGSGPVTNYEIYRDDGLGGAIVFLDEIGDFLTYTDVDPGIVLGRTYRYQVAAKNLAGIGMGSNIATATTATVPDAPTIVSATGTSATEVTVTWLAPGYDGGSPILSYDVEYTPASTGIPAISNTGAVVLTWPVPGLSNFDTYSFRVRAKNLVGDGAYSASIAGVAPLSNFIDTFEPPTWASPPVVFNGP